MADKFECWSCGACCKMAGLNHPELDRGDGACINLTPDNLCSIYDDRPDFCRLNPERPVAEQEKWCKLIESNWQEYTVSLRGLTETLGCGMMSPRTQRSMKGSSVLGPLSPPVEKT